MRHTLLLLVTIVLVLTGCTRHHQKVVHLIPWSEHEYQRSQLLNWRVAGHYQVTHLSHEWSGRFAWRQHDEHGQLMLLNPLGGLEARLEHSLRHARLHLRSGQNYESDNPEVLMGKVLEMPVPVSRLCYWLKGIPMPGESYRIVKKFGNGLPATLVQSGWTIEYIRYAPNTLPTEVILRHGPTYIHLHLSQWQLNPQGAPQHVPGTPVVRHHTHHYVTRAR